MLSWWSRQTRGEKAFFLIHTPILVFMLVFPGYFLEYQADTVDGWWKANQDVVGALFGFVLLGWIFLIFFVRWAIGWILCLIYKEHDLRLPIRPDNTHSYWKNSG